MPASNQTGRVDPAALGMVHRDVGAAEQVGDSRLRRAAADAIPAKALTWIIRSSSRNGRVTAAQDRFGGDLGAGQPVRGERESDREFVAAQARDDRAGTKLVVKRCGNALSEAARPSHSHAGR